MTQEWQDHGLSIKITDDSSFNARATKCTRAYEIDIHRGAIEHLFGAFHCLFGCPSFLPQIGVASDEATPKCILDAGHIIPLPILRLDTPKWDAMPYPNDAERQRFAHQLATMALQFLVFHEVGHVVAGHLELLYGNSQHARMSEVSATFNGGDEVSRACECDADFFATHVTNAVDADEKMATLTHQAIAQTNWTPAQAAQVLHMMSVGVLFRISSPDAPLGVFQNSGSHPHPAARTAATCAYSLALTTDAGKLTPDSMDNLYLDSLVNLEDVWAELQLRGQIGGSRERWAASILQGMSDSLATFSKFRNDIAERAHLNRAWDPT